MLQHCILGAAKGNLAYQKFMFSIRKSTNLNEVLFFIHHFERRHVKDKHFCDIDPQDSSWSLNIARNKKALGEKQPPRISIDSLHIGEISESLEPTPRNILKSIRSMYSRVDNLN
uniref:Uncharacterized protein n=1 Tax=Lactuca sativa TaxID=4236 RepID=A0A9R1XHV0_LACSA|nr:hypothetical protein LSAT_V11C300116540 [Lactuca sativa]